MRGYLSHHILLLLLLIVCTTATAQQDSSHLGKLLSLPDKVFGKIDNASQKLSQQLDKQTEKYLSRLEKQEQKLKRKLWRTDSLKAKELFGDVEERYASLRNKLTGNEQQQFSSVYSAHADSLTTALNFLNENPALTTISKNLSSNLSNVTALQNKFNQTEQIRKQIKARQNALKQHLQNTPLAKEFAKYKKQVYYYQAQLKEYRQALNDPKLMGTKLIAEAKKIPAFDQFFRNHSELASLFQLPGSSAANLNAMQISVNGLQTRAGLQQQLMNQFGQQMFTPPSAGQANPFQQQIQDAQQHLEKLKNKPGSLLNAGADEEEPEFIPNETKTQSFKKRFVYATNIQSNRGRGIMVNSTDLGFSLGYKLNDKSVLGVGGSYRAGLGQGFNNIRVTHEGVSWRSYLDYYPALTFLGRMGKSIWITGAYERNYFAVINRIEALRNADAWKTSLLLGASKVVDLKTKFFKKTKLSLLYDFNWRQPGNVQTQPVVFRVNYQF